MCDLSVKNDEKDGPKQTDVKFVTIYVDNFHVEMI